MTFSSRCARTATAVVGSALALATVACGDSSEADTPEAQVESAFADYNIAQRDGDGAKACAAMTQEVQKTFGFGKSCEARVAELGVLLPDDYKLPKLVQVEANGNTVTARIKTIGGSRAYPITFTKQDGVWKISDGPFGPKGGKGSTKR